MIGLMVGLLLAGLLGWYFLSRRTGGNLTTTGGAPANTTVNGITYGPDGLPITTDGTKVQLGNTILTVAPDSSQKAAAAAGATSYNLDDPATRQRQLDAINRENQAAAYGLTAQVQAQRDADAKAAADAQTAAGGGYQYKPTNGIVPTVVPFFSSSGAGGLAQPVNNSPPPLVPPPSPGPGYYWNYAANAWQPLLV